MTKRLEEAALTVTSEQEPQIIVTVTLTSPLMRNPAVHGSENGEAAAGGKIYISIYLKGNAKLKNNDFLRRIPSFFKF